MPSSLTPLDTDLYRLLCSLEGRSTLTQMPHAWSDLEAAGRVTIESRVVQDDKGVWWRVKAIVRKRGPKAKPARAAR
jgi:hypothetical protein